MNFDVADIKAHPSQAFSVGIATLAAVLHIAFLGLFLWSDVTTLVMLNIASVASHILALLLINRKQELKGLMVIVAEVAIHAIVATCYTGWSSGFHYYFILVVPMIGLSNIRPIKIKAFSVFITILAYLIFDLEFRLGNNSNALTDEIGRIFYYFNMVAVMLTLAFMAFSYHYLISQAEDALVAAANTDPLTQLSNRRCFMQAVEKEMDRTKRNQIDLSFIICDLDYFKAINDRHGHEAGDMVLKAVRHLLSSEIRHCDKLSRWGGEEFLIMIPEITRTEALMTAERLRKKTEDLQLFFNGERIKLSMTLGVTSLTNTENAEHAIARADAGLYKGKTSGRNCAVLV